jgi:hypothetical protein
MTLTHPNRLPFHGVLTFVDTPSDKSPTGARGHRVNLSRKAAEDALPGLIGMAVDYRPGFTGHDCRRKLGVITHARIMGRTIRVQGYVYVRDFPDVISQINEQEVMGMSYELADARVEDMRAEVWTLTRVSFTGAAIVLRTKTAYTATTFVLERTDHAWDSKEVDLQTLCPHTDAHSATAAPCISADDGCSE